jgi:hypothetical protein
MSEVIACLYCLTYSTVVFVYVVTDFIKVISVYITSVEKLNLCLKHFMEKNCSIFFK